MGETWRVTQDASDDLGFAMSCLASWAVDLDEFHVWVYRVIVDSDDVPEHLLNLSDAMHRFDVTLHWRDLIGWWPSWDPTRLETEALDGIAYARFPEHRSDAVGRAAALAALRASPLLLERFVHFFPGVEVPGFTPRGRAEPRPGSSPGSR